MCNIISHMRFFLNMINYMSQGQPLSSLAPEYSKEVSEVQVAIIQSSCPPKQIDCAPPCSVECPKKVECPCPKDPCPDPRVKDLCVKDPCDNPCTTCVTTGYKWSWLGALVLWFIVFAVLFYLVFFSLKPSFVLQTDSNQVDTSLVLLYALVASLILIIIIWLIKAAVSSR